MAVTSGLRSQSVFVKTDHDRILIGERLEYVLNIKMPSAGYTINFNLPDSIPHFDVIENMKYDSISSNGSLLLQKKIIFTSFDSGAWYMPSFPVTLELNKASSKFNTDSILVNVDYAPSDSTDAVRDIKPVIEVTYKDYSWIYIAAGILGAIILLLIIYFYLKNRTKKEKPVFHSALSAYDEAMQSLNELEKQGLEKPEQVKSYHTALAGIFRKYYSRKQDKNLMVKTTSDILINVKEKFDSTIVSTLAEVLRCADAVKFAKYLPAPAESKQSHAQVKQVIEMVENNNKGSQ